MSSDWSIGETVASLNLKQQELCVLCIDIPGDDVFSILRLIPA